ncbi:hypothetical protein SDC9_194313 [bioreactor metagenome]|uniref:Uncharacterized protein n=1 Tax=bioreactor metagenome TaxID=1076179 RepID=A0A645I746_9ZZZZ
MFFKCIGKSEFGLEFVIGNPLKHQRVILLTKPGNIELLFQDRLVTELQSIDIGNIRTDEFYSQS